MSFDLVAAEFNRCNQVQLVVEGDSAGIHLSGNFDAHNIDGFARLAHEGFGLQVRCDGDRIVLKWATARDSRAAFR